MFCRVAKIAMALCVIVFARISIYAQNPGGLMVDVNIHFRYDTAHIDSTYMRNKEMLHVVDSLLKDSLYVSTLHKIEIQAQSSIEGSLSYNRQLSERRKASLREYFMGNYPQVDSLLWSFKSVAENWALFHQQLEADHGLPDRDQILAISASRGRGADDKERQLRRMNGGETWGYIADNILPSQRLGAGVLFVPMLLSPLAKPAIFTSPLRSMPLEMPIEPQEQRLIFALKSNLLLDALTGEQAPFYF